MSDGAEDPREVQEDPLCGHCGYRVIHSNGYKNSDGTVCHISCHDGRIRYQPESYSHLGHKVVADTPFGMTPMYLSHDDPKVLEGVKGGTTDSGAWRRGDWLQTYSSKRFYPLNPRSQDIDAEDIAHALSLLCRYGGHVDRFYSVAEHCFLMSHAVATENALAALLHDATEAYVGDVVRPLKRQLPDYQRVEHQVWLAIAHHFRLGPIPDEVKEADNRILLTERNALMPRTRYSWEVDTKYTPLPVTVTGWSPGDAEQYYWERLKELTE